MEYLFHCFPGQCGRFRDLDAAQQSHYCKIGIAILRSILEHGLLLTPEDVKVRRHPGSAQEAESPVILEQVRACFTLASTEALGSANPYDSDGRSHLDLFGCFAVGLDPLVSRLFDMTPVFYFYSESGEKSSGQAEYYPTIASLVHALVETRELLSILTRCEERAVVGLGRSSRVYEATREQFDDAGIRLQYQQRGTAAALERRLQELTPEEAERFVGLLDTDRRPLWDLVEAIDLLAGLVQSTDSRSLRSRLLYYSQREWRLNKVVNGASAGFTLGGRTVGEAPATQRLRAAALESIEAVSGLIGRSPTRQWLEKCWVLWGSRLTGKPFREHVEVVLCPAAAEAEVRRLLSAAFQGSGRQPVVRLVDREGVV